MYRIVCDGQVILDQAIQEHLKVVNPSLTIALNEAGSLEFALPKTHPQCGKPEPLGSYFSVEDDGQEVFYGRIFEHSKPTFTGQITYQGEGALRFLEDAEIPPDGKDENGNQNSRDLSAEAFFRWCIDRYNEEIGNDVRRKLTVGVVNATKKDKVDTYSISSYTTVKSALESMVINNYGGFLRIRSNGGDGHLIDWVQHYSDRVNAQVVKIGENVIDETLSESGENVYTVLRPVGKDLLMLPEKTISLFPAETMNKYGRIIKTVQFNDAEDEATLRARATEYISKINASLYSDCDIKMVDLHYLDGTQPKIWLGDRFTNLEGIEGTEMTIDNMTVLFNTPWDNSISMKNPKQLEPNENIPGKNNSRVNSISKASSRSRSSSGVNFKYIQEIGEEVLINASKLTLQGDDLRVAYQRIEQTANSLIDVSRKTETNAALIGRIEGTGVIRNDELLTNFAGQIDVLKDNDGNVIGVKFVEGAMVQLTDSGGHMVTVGESIANHTTSLQRIEGSALWTQREGIVGVAGQYELDWDYDPVFKLLNGKKIPDPTDPYGFERAKYESTQNDYPAGEYKRIPIDNLPEAAHGKARWNTPTDWKRHNILKIRSGTQLRIGRESGDFAVYDVNEFGESVMTAGVIVEKINGGTVRIKGQKVIVGADADDPDVLEKFGDTDAELLAAKARILSLETDYLKTSELYSKISLLDTVYAKKLNTTTVVAGDLYFTTHTVIPGQTSYDTKTSLKNSIAEVRVTSLGSNKYKLQYKTFNDSDWKDATGTFDRASLLKGSWSGGVFTVSEDSSGSYAPIASTQLKYELSGNPSRSGKNITQTVKLRWFDASLVDLTTNPYSDTGYENDVTINATSVYNAGWDYGQTQRTRTTGAAASTDTTIKTLDYSERFKITDTYTKANGTTFTTTYVVASKADRYSTGYSDGRPSSVTIGSQVTGTTYNVTVKRADNATVALTANCSGPYNDGKNSVTVSGMSLSGTTVTAIASNGASNTLDVSSLYDVETSEIGIDQISLKGQYESTGGRTRAGSISKSSISAPGYLFFRAGCRGTNKLYYIVINT